MDYSMPDSLSFTISQSLLKLMSIESMMSCDYLILCCPLLLLPSIFPSIRVFSNESTFCIRWPKCWNFSFSISPSSEYSGLISFRENFFLAVQGTLKSLLQHHGLKASILWCSAIFMVLPSHLYMTTGSVWARWLHLLLLDAYFFSIGSCPDLYVLILFNWILKEEPWRSLKLFLELFAFWLTVLQTLSVHPPWIILSLIPLTHKSWQVPPCFHLHVMWHGALCISILDQS